MASDHALKLKSGPGTVVSVQAGSGSVLSFFNILKFGVPR